MSKVNFFTALSLLIEDKESIELKVQKTGDELTVLVVPKIKNKTATVTMSGTAEDLDEGFMDELNKPIEKINGLVSNASEVEVTDVEEEEEEESEEKEAAAPKKSSAKKEVKKTVKPAPKKGAVKKEKITETENSTSEDDELAKENENAIAAIENRELEEEKARIEAEIEAKEDEEEKARVQADWEARFAAEKAEEEAKAEEARIEAERLEAERVNAEGLAMRKDLFNEYMKSGAEAFTGRKFLQAETDYRKATEIFPEDAKAQAEFSKAAKWVKQLREAGIKLEEGVENGA